MSARDGVRICIAVFGLVAAVSRSAAAQPADSAPRVLVGAGGGIAFPFHGDFDFTPWAWDADVRIALSRRLLFEAFVGEWRRTETTVQQNVIAQDITGPIGTSGRLEQATRRVQRAMQVNMLVSGGVGRVRLFGGGGVGLLQHNRRVRQTIEDCSPSVASSCGSTENTFSNISGSVQGVGGADIGITGPLSAYGQARLTVPTSDPAGTDLRVSAGIRVGW